MRGGETGKPGVTGRDWPSPGGGGDEPTKDGDQDAMPSELSGWP